MSSGSGIGAIAGLAVAAVGAYFTGGASLAAYGAAFASYAGAAISVGAAVGGMLYPTKGPENNGPRLSDLTVQTSTYGAFIPRAYSTIAMSGNLFWLENGKLKEVAKKAKSGGKGGMMGGGSGQTTYSYYATFALGLCDCSNGRPIVGIRRLWVGPKLIYDAGSNDHTTLIASNQAATGFKVYLGTDTQLPDTRMEATLGVGNVPGYRGLAYIVFYDLPLADYGNSLVVAQIKAEVVCDGALNHILDLESSIAATGTTVIRSSNNNYIYVVGSTLWSIYDISVPSTPLLVNQITPTTGLIAYAAVDDYYAYSLGSTLPGHPDTMTLCVYDLSDPLVPLPIATLSVGTQNYALAAQNHYVMVGGSYGHVIQMIDVTHPYSPVIISTLTGMNHTVDIVMNGDFAYAIDGNDNVLRVIDISNKSSITVLSSISISSANANMSAKGNYIYLNSYLGGFFKIIDVSNPYSPSEVYSSSLIPGGPIDIADHYMFVGKSRDYSRLYVYDISNPILPFFIDYIQTTSATAGEYSVLAMSDNYIYTYNGANNHLETFFFIDGHITQNTVPLSTIVEAEVINSKLLTSADIDASLLTSPVRGYRIASVGSIRGGIEPLQGSWPFDVIQHGYKIKCVPRGLSSVATITTDLLDARTGDSQPGVIITNSREMDSILPQKVSIKYFDIDREYDQGEQYSERINTDAVNISALDMSIVFNANEAAGKSQVLLYLYWMERYDIAFSLPFQYNYLEPSDVITIVSDNATYNLRLVSINYTSDGRMECGAKFNDTAIYTPTAIGSTGVFTGQTLVLQGDTIYQLLDIPMIQDVYNTTGFPAAMTGYRSGWLGGSLFRTIDNGQNWDDLQGFSAPGSTMGYATDTLSSHSGTVLDKTSVLTAHIYQGTLSSVTEQQMFAGANWFAYGKDQRWEIIAAQKCVLQSDGSYILTDFLRGQFGTEWATGLHVIGDSIVHLSSSELAWISMNQSYIGVEANYRGITNGALIDSDTNRSFTYRGVNLECLSPCQPTGSINPSTNDWTINWTRRTRYAGWRDAVDATLGETTESYEVDVFSDNTYTTVKRTLASTTQTVQYTSVQQTTDFGGNQTTLYLKIYQLSAIVGRGYPLTVSLAR